METFEAMPKSTLTLSDTDRRSERYKLLTIISIWVWKCWSQLNLRTIEQYRCQLPLSVVTEEAINRIISLQIQPVPSNTHNVNERHYCHGLFTLTETGVVQGTGLAQ